MATTLTWSIQQIQTSTKEINGFSEVVLSVSWNLKCSDGNYAYNVNNTVALNPPQEGDLEFTPYADLTEEQVLSWVWESGVDKNAVEESAAKQVELTLNPPVVTPPLPWESSIVA
jgi:hypothetical protein